MLVAACVFKSYVIYWDDENIQLQPPTAPSVLLKLLHKATEE